MFIRIKSSLLVSQFIFTITYNTAYWVVLTSIAATCVLWILVSLLTKPDPEKKLVEFYQLARPLGWWNPIARKAKLNPAGHRPILNGPGIALVGTVMVAA